MRHISADNLQRVTLEKLSEVTCLWISFLDCCIAAAAYLSRSGRGTELLYLAVLERRDAFKYLGGCWEIIQEIMDFFASVCPRM